VKKMNNDVYKTDEKEGVSSWKELYKAGRVETLGWGLIFLWGALVVLIEATTNIKSTTWWDGWAVFFAGVGMIALAGAVVAIQFKDYDKAGWNFIIGFIVLGFAIGGIFNTDYAWVFVLFGIAAVLLVGAFVKSPEKKEHRWWCWE
jgi:uncharacterized membrane protein YhaH (DUF805 family)